MKRTIPFLALAVAVTAVFSAGCGGGEDESTAAQPLSKADYIKQATKICSVAHDDQVEATQAVISGEVGKGETNAERRLNLANEIFAITGRMIDELSELPAPTKDEKQVSEMLTLYEKNLEHAEGEPDSYFLLNPFGQAVKAANAYGLEDCQI